jgi:formylmethanofuran dehydrogenase subunit C
VTTSRPGRADRRERAARRSGRRPAAVRRSRGPSSPPAASSGTGCSTTRSRPSSSAGIVEYTYDIANVDRTVGARLGGAVGLEFGSAEPQGLARLRFSGEAGQSFGAFVSAGIELVLDGEANDYVGKGLGGGASSSAPPRTTPATRCWSATPCSTARRAASCSSRADRRAVRRAQLRRDRGGRGHRRPRVRVHDGGTVVVLGPTGHNVGAGMSGGECFVFDPDVLARVNRQLVEARRPDGGSSPGSGSSSSSTRP